MNHPGYAERNGEYIIEEIMEKMFQANKYRVDEGYSSGDNSSGLYIFTVKDRRRREYPVYVGYTSRSFKIRFREHRNNGVIHDFHTGVYPQHNWNHYTLYVYTYSRDFAAAKLLESIFLRSFDFARNTEENNNQTHNNLRIPPENLPEDSKASFAEGYQAIMEDVKEIQDKFSDLLGH